MQKGDSNNQFLNLILKQKYANLEWDVAKNHASNTKSLRILEIDGKHSDNVTIDSRLALNAMKVVWKPGIDAPIMNITIKCLSFTPEETTEGM